MRQHRSAASVHGQRLGLNVRLEGGGRAARCYGGGADNQGCFRIWGLTDRAAAGTEFDRAAGTVSSGPCFRIWLGIPRGPFL